MTFTFCKRKKIFQWDKFMIWIGNTFLCLWTHLYTHISQNSLPVWPHYMLIGYLDAQSLTILHLTTNHIDTWNQVNCLTREFHAIVGPPSRAECPSTEESYLWSSEIIAKNKTLKKCQNCLFHSWTFISKIELKFNYMKLIFLKNEIIFAPLL